MHVYFSGLGGVAIGPLALICRDCGYHVSGSDQQQTRWTRLIEQEGIPVAIGQDGSQIAAANAAEPIDWLVISAAIAEDHPEVAFARQHGIKISKRAEMLNHILSDKQLKLVAVGGTHGKTTTTAMLTWLFMQFHKPVSYSVGSHMSFGPSGHYQPGSRYFVYEADEYDRNMLEFSPYLTLLTSIDYDHPDIYPTRESYIEAFQQFATQSQLTLAWQEDIAHASLEGAIALQENDASIKTIRLPGLHNRQNAWQAANAFHHLFPDIPLDHILTQVSQFPGTDRRFEKLAPHVYTSYDHHPTEIRAALQLARELSDHVVVIYQPHQNMRQHEIQDEYRDSFTGASHVYWLPTYLSREDPKLAILQPQDLIAKLNNPTVAEPADMNEQLVQHIRQDLENGALILFLGAGSIDEWAREYFGAKEKI